MLLARRVCRLLDLDGPCLRKHHHACELFTLASGFISGFRSVRGYRGQLSLTASPDRDAPCQRWPAAGIAGHFSRVRACCGLPGQRGMAGPARAWSRVDPEPPWTAIWSRWLGVELFPASLILGRRRRDCNRWNLFWFSGASWFSPLKLSLGGCFLLVSFSTLP